MIGLTLIDPAASAVASCTEWSHEPLGPAGRRTLLARAPSVDGLVLQRASAAEHPTPGALILGMFRYDRTPQVFHQALLPWATIRGGLYLRSAVPYRVRVLAHPDGAGLTMRVAVEQPASVAVYEEAPLGAETLPPCQLVVVIDAAGADRL